MRHRPTDPTPERLLSVSFKWTPELEDLADRLLSDGASFRETAKTIGCHHTTVMARFSGRGWSMVQRADMSSHRMRMRHAVVGGQR